MPDKHARAIPQLEAFEKVLALEKQRMSLCNGIFIREFGEFVDVPGHRISHESVAGTLKASQATRRIGSIRRRPAFIGYEANGHIGKRP